jgi:dimethylglycine dehydrogenase
MSGFSQGGAIGLVLANWLVDGDPDHDVYGMDVARYGAFASNERYLRERTAQFYARRFVIAYPNEELPAGRPLRTTPAYDLQREGGARFGVVWATESPQYFAPGEPGYTEEPTLRRSSASRFIAAEVAATRSGAGLLDTGVYARYEVRGPGARAWLDRLVTSRLPAPGRMRLAPMLAPSGRLLGDLSVSCLAEDHYWIVGSYALQEWHLRWMRDHLPPSGVQLENLSESWLGVSLSGPNAREVLVRAGAVDCGGDALPFLGLGWRDVGCSRALVARVSLTGELGYEINVPALQQRGLWQALLQAGEGLGLRPIGMRAQDSLRLEKGYGIWSREFAASYTPSMCGLDRFIDFDKGDFIGRDAALAARGTVPERTLVLLAVDAPDADTGGYEPVFCDGQRVGYVTSGGYGHHVQMSLALAYVEPAALQSGGALTVPVVGQPCAARVLATPPYDPRGERMRG